MIKTTRLHGANRQKPIANSQGLTPDASPNSHCYIRYIYDASGRKLWQGVFFAAGFKQTDYAGEFIYEGDALQFVNQEEGRIVIAANTLLYTNRAESVTDFTAVSATLAAVTQNGTETYVRVTSTGTTSRTGMFPIGGTFTVAAGDKYRIRVKGYRTGSSAAYIQVKASGTDIIWPGAAIASNVASESWAEQTVTIPAGATTLQVGVNWNTVTANEIMYVNEVEITKLATIATPEYQYHLKDHLGNVRTTFTTVTTIDQTTATLEAANLNTEQSQFVRIANAKRVYSTLFDKTNGASAGYSQRLNGSTNEKFGIAKSLSVMPGDVIQAQVYAKYVDPNSSNWIGILPSLMSQIAANQAGVVYDGASYSTSTTSFPYPNAGSGSPSPPAPKAYLNWIVFDRNFVQKTFGYTRITSASREYGQDVAHELLSSPNITIAEAGYVYIYVSNEETTPIEVYFDDFKVTYTKSPVVQVDEYYPFGLAFNSYSRENGLSQDFKYNGKELQDELGLGWLDYGARMYVAETGRWSSVDPLADKMRRHSPYNYAFDNPIRFLDPDGMQPSPGPYGGNPLNLWAREMGTAFRGLGKTIDKLNARVEAFFSFGVETGGRSGTATGNISNETRTTISAGTTAEDFLTPTSDNKQVSSTPFEFSVVTTNETKATISSNTSVDGVDIHAKNVTSTDNQTGKISNTTTITVGKDQTGIFVETGTKGSKVGVRTEQKLASPNGSFIKFGGSMSVGTKTDGKKDAKQN